MKRALVAVAGCGATVAGLAGVVVFDRLLVAAGRTELGLFGLDDLPFVVAFLSAGAVGAALAFRRSKHPVGWLFLALGASFVAAGLLDGYTAYGELRGWPGVAVAAALGDVAFIPWFVLLALILQLTPTGRPWWRWGPVAAVVVGGLWLVFALVDLQPWRLMFGVLTAAALVLSGLLLLLRFHRSKGTERRQLLWLALAVVPLPLFVGIAFYASDDHPVLLSLATSGFIVLIPVATGLAVAKYHLYDVERILSRAVTYLLVSGVLVCTFAAAAFTAGLLAGDSAVPAVLGTLAAVAVAGPVYRAFQEVVDRRFNRRRYDTLRVVREYVRSPAAQDVEEVLRRALGDEGLRAAYWVEDRGQWVTSAGQQLVPGDDELAVRRGDREVARLAVRTDRELVAAAAAEALPELENAGLRAAISLQLVEVRESRARIAAAQLAERHRIERDLHDGAQQRLLALALNLRAAQLNGKALDQAVEAAIGELRAAVSELRELANGLLPAVLADAGLAAAVDELSARLPLPVRVEVPDRRFSAAVETTAWFIVCEAVTNAVKHADAQVIAVRIRAEDNQLVVRVEDDGRGAADADGSGLRGIADRAEALGGSLMLETRADGGTAVIGRLPCES